MKNKRVVLGVSGGIAAYKAAQLCSLLRKAGAEVRVVMTPNATRFLQPLTLETLSGNAVSVEEFSHTFEIGHISLAKWADAFVVAPATANILAKFACGIADDLLSTTFLAMTCPVLVAPAMNCAMWKNPATVANMRTLRDRKIRVVGPESGRLACGDEDIGRMSEPETILAALREALSTATRDFEGKRVLVTAGPTREPLDPVRFIGNRSSGRMGYAIAQAAIDRGASVTLLSGPVSIEPPKGATVIRVETTMELYEAAVSAAREADCVIQAAAPADFRAESVADTKIKRTGEDLSIRLTPNPDIAAALGKAKREGQALVAFAAETGDTIANAKGKLIKKNADFIVANDVTQPGAGFDVPTNIITLVDARGETPLPLMSKREAADKILDRVLAVWSEAAAEPGLRK